MAKKVGIKHKLSMATYNQTELNKKAIIFKKSIDEINKMLNPRDTK